MDPNAAPATSRFTVTIVIVFIGAFALLSLASVDVLIATHAKLAEVAIVAGGMTTSLGALVGLLISTKVANPIPVKDLAAMPPVPAPAVTTTTTTETAVHPPADVTTDVTTTKDDEPLDEGA